MKKTLIALAVLAASGASFAQATITGNYTAGYSSAKTAAGVNTAGFGTDTAKVSFNASEDLGGGMKVTAELTAAGITRGSTVGGEDAKLNLIGGFGVVTLGTVEAGNAMWGKANAGAPLMGLDGNVLVGAGNVDLLQYTLPVGAFSFKANYTDRGTAVGAIGLGNGSTGVAGNQSAVTIGAAYAAGPIDAFFDATNYQRQGDADVAVNVQKDRMRLAGTYDLGVAKVGLGWERRSLTTDTTTNETAAGVKVPMGALTLGLGWARSTTSGSSADKTGYQLGAQYDLSKQTNVSTGYSNWSTNGVDGNNTGFRILVSKSF